MNMENWYSTSLGDGMTSTLLSDEIEAEFLKLFTTAGKPSNMAIFTRGESEGRLHCEVIAYFSPAAKELAPAFNAEPCTKPMRGGLSLLVGDAEAWSVLFPESSSGVINTTG